MQVQHFEQREEAMEHTALKYLWLQIKGFINWLELKGRPFKSFAQYLLQKYKRGKVGKDISLNIHLRWVRRSNCRCKKLMCGPGAYIIRQDGNATSPVSCDISRLIPPQKRILIFHVMRTFSPLLVIRLYELYNGSHINEFKRIIRKHDEKY